MHSKINVPFERSTESSLLSFCFQSEIILERNYPHCRDLCDVGCCAMRPRLHDDQLLQ